MSGRGQGWGGNSEQCGAGQQEGGGRSRGCWQEMPEAHGDHEHREEREPHRAARQRGEKGRNKPGERWRKRSRRRRKGKRRRRRKGERGGGERGGRKGKRGGRRGRGGGIGGGRSREGEKSDVEGLALESGAGLSNVAKCRWRKSEWTLLALADGSKLCCYEGSQPHNISL